MKVSVATLITIVIGTCAAAHDATADLIANRSLLEELLGNSAVTEDFESIVVPSTGPVEGLVQFNQGLNSRTLGEGDAAGLGPGLVVPGITFRAFGQTQIVTPSLVGSTSQLLGWSSGSPFTFEFDRPARAVGIDMFAVFGGDGNPFIEVDDADGNTIAQFQLGRIDSPTVPLFFGFENEAGISEVRAYTFIGGPFFDNVTFALLIPEPSSIVLLCSASTLALIRVTGASMRDA